MEVDNIQDEVKEKAKKDIEILANLLYTAGKLSLLMMIESDIRDEKREEYEYLLEKLKEEYVKLVNKLNSKRLREYLAKYKDCYFSSTQKDYVIASINLLLVILLEEENLFTNYIEEMKEFYL